MSQYLPYLALVLSVAINVLQFVAPRTKNTKDDKALELLEAAQGMLPKQPPKA